MNEDSAGDKDANNRTLVQKIPWALIWFRALAGLSPWICALFGWSMWIAAVLIPLALLSDIFDGVIARAQGVATELLRRADGWSDLTFVLSFTAYVIIMRWEVLAPLFPWIAAVGVYKAIGTAHDFMRYGRGAAFHFWSAKLWALPYYALLFELVIGREQLWFFWPTIIMGFIAITEEFVAVRLIPVWMHDQPNVVSAVKAYREMVDNAKRK